MPAFNKTVVPACKMVLDPLASIIPEALSKMVDVNEMFDKLLNGLIDDSIKVCHAMLLLHLCLLTLFFVTLSFLSECPQVIDLAFFGDRIGKVISLLSLFVVFLVR
jgi:hypothetical protein